MMDLSYFMINRMKKHGTNCNSSALFFFQKFGGRLALFGANLIWGTSFLFTKLLLIYIPPVTVAFIRFVIASFILTFYIKIFKKEKMIIFQRDILNLVMLGLFGITIYYYGENTSLQTITISSASLILSLIPAVTLILSVVVLGEKVFWFNVLGVIIAFVGASFIILKDTNLYELSKFEVGYIYILIATLSFSIYSIIGRKVMLKRSAIHTTAFTFIFGSILLIPFVFYEISSLSIRADLSKIALNLLYLSFVCSIGGYFLWNWGLKQINPGRASIYLNIIPLTAVLLGTLFLGEKITLGIVIGGGLILSGIYIANYK